MPGLCGMKTILWNFLSAGFVYKLSKYGDREIELILESQDGNDPTDINVQKVLKEPETQPLLIQFPTNSSHLRRTCEKGKIILHCVRHAIAVHNVMAAKGDIASARNIHDPPLTHRGIYQCALLCKTFPHERSITHIVCSPSRRTIQTAIMSFRPLLKRGLRIILLSSLKEYGNIPCNTGSDVKVLKEEFGGMPIVYNKLETGWESSFSNEKKEHAGRVRECLYHLGQNALARGEVNKDGNVEILVVSHGHFLRYLEGGGSHSKWKNTQHRKFEFIHDNNKDDTPTPSSYKLRETSDSGMKINTGRGHRPGDFSMCSWDQKEYDYLHELPHDAMNQAATLPRDVCVMPKGVRAMPRIGLSKALEEVSE